MEKLEKDSCYALNKSPYWKLNDEEKNAYWKQAMNNDNVTFTAGEFVDVLDELDIDNYLDLPNGNHAYTMHDIHAIINGYKELILYVWFKKHNHTRPL